MIERITCKFECLTGICGVINCKVKKQLNTLISRKSYKYNINKDDMRQLFINCINNGFICPYCERPLNLFAHKDKWSLARATSIDHIQSRRMKGSNELSNLKIICHACNEVKSVTNPDIWIKIVNTLKLQDIKEFQKYIDDQYGINTYKNIESGYWEGKKEVE